MLPLSLEAGLWGLLAGSGLLLGAMIAYFVELPHRLIAAVMGFGGGVLVAVLAADLMQKAYTDGGVLPMIGGFLGGAVIFCSINWMLSKRGAKHRKRSGHHDKQMCEAEMAGSGVAIAVGAVLDGIPESIAIGLSLLGGGEIGVALVAGFFLANLPQGLSSASGMKAAGRSSAYILGVWGGIAIVSGIAAFFGYVAFAGSPPVYLAVLLAFAAGGILAMLAETMMPEAFEEAHHFIGIATVVGFLVAFLLIKSEEVMPGI